MKIYDVPLYPRSAFGTPLKGDTLFGHVCWQVADDADLAEGGLGKQLARYAEAPFAVISSAFPRTRNETGGYGWAIKRPDMPPHLLRRFEGTKLETMMAEKDLKTRPWMNVSGWGKIHLLDAEYVSFPGRSGGGQGQPAGLTALRPHNTINRRTGTTGSAPFAPYVKDEVVYPPGTVLSLFVLLDTESMEIGGMRTALQRIGTFGYGRDASTGLGRFDVGDPVPLADPDVAGADALYTLAPSIPNPEDWGAVWCMPFVRFGKFGDRRAVSRNPFKDPVVMADEGAVLIPKKEGRAEPKPYVGRSVSGVSRIFPEAVVQGYSPILPLTME